MIYVAITSFSPLKTDGIVYKEENAIKWLAEGKRVISVKNSEELKQVAQGEIDAGTKEIVLSTRRKQKGV